MKLALLGYGKMGKEIENTALERKHSIELTIDINNQHDLIAVNLRKADVAIDFSTPGSAYGNIMKCFEADIPVVCGTTGWLDRFDEVVGYCKANQKSFFYASNFSIGVYLFFDINRKLARVMNRFTDYDVSIEETHHIHKLDAPSGTAIALAKDIISEIDRKKQWELGNETKPESLLIKAIRENEIPGIHKVTYDSAIDSISVTHSAKNRKGLAQGAVLAAEFIYNKKGFFTMSDLMGEE